MTWFFSLKGEFYMPFKYCVQRGRPKWQQKMLSTKFGIIILFTWVLQRQVAKNNLPDKEKLRETSRCRRAQTSTQSSTKTLKSRYQLLLFFQNLTVVYILVRSLHSIFMKKWGGSEVWRCWETFKRPLSKTVADKENSFLNSDSYISFYPTQELILGAKILDDHKFFCR